MRSCCRNGEMRSCKPRNSVIPGHDLGGGNGMHANATPGAAWMSRRRVTCLIQLDHSPFWPIDVHIGHVDTQRCSWVCAGMKTNPQDRSGGLSDRPGVPTERLSRHISIGIDSSDTKGYYGSVLKRSSYSSAGPQRRPLATPLLASTYHTADLRLRY